jgi:prohibitin 2
VFFIALVLTIVLAGGFILYGLKDTFLSDGRDSPKVAPIVVGIVIGILGLFVTMGIRTIEPGHVGVVREWGAITGRTIGQGVTWLMPLQNSVDDVNIQVRAVSIEGYTAATIEQQDLFLNLTLNYHVSPDKAYILLRDIGSDFEDKIVHPRLQDIPKSVTDDYQATVVLNRREEIRDKMIGLLKSSLEPYGLVVDNIAIENFSYSDQYNQEIENKQTAQQAVETAKQQVEKAKQEAFAAQEKAKGEANAAIELAKGEAARRVAVAEGDRQAQIAIAQGQSEANRLIAASLTDDVLLSRYIDKIAPTIQTILVPPGQEFLLDLNGLRKVAQ